MGRGRGREREGEKEKERERGREKERGERGRENKMYEGQFGNSRVYYIYIISLFIHTLKYNAVHKYTVLRWI